MNKLERYEQIIAEKLDQRPLPDIADALWQRVEKQLDMDLPATDQTLGQPPSPPGTGWPTWLKLLALISIVFVIVFLLVKKPGTGNKSKQPSVTPGSATPLQDSTRFTDTSLRSDQPQQKKKSIKLYNINAEASDTIDAATGPVDRVVTMDSMMSLPRNILPDTIAITPRQNPPLKKNQKGVVLNDSDYRIITGKNDSL